MFGLKEGKHKPSFNPNSLIIYIQKISINIILFWQSYYTILTIYLISIIYITDMLPQHPANIKELFCECF